MRNKVGEESGTPTKKMQERKRQSNKENAPIHRKLNGKKQKEKT